MATPDFFTTIKRSFADVPMESEKIATTEFLEACEGLTTLFDVLGSAAFKPVKGDMTGNIKKIRDRQMASPKDSSTLQDLVLNERKQGNKTATEGLTWLNRGLDFTSASLRRNINDQNEELADSFKTAYTTTLKPYHSFVVKPVFNLAMSATPYRKDFYAKLGGTQAQLDAYVDALEKQVAIIKAFLATPEAKY